MGSKSDYLENKVLDHCLGLTAFTFPTSVWIALYTVAPTDAGGGTEVTGGSYARLEVAGATGRDFKAAVAGATENNEEWSFTQATADWGTVVAFSVMDAVTAGNFLYWGDITPNKAVNSGDTAKFAAGDLDITED